jgi:glc operon protein GlcG
MKRLPVVLVLLCVSFQISLFGQSADTKALTLDNAKRIADAAELRAHENNWTVAIVVVDAGGQLILFRKIDGTQAASIDIAVQKARTAAFYKRPTKIFQDRLAAGENAILSLPDMMPFEGGLPIIHNGTVAGAIGVSGVTAEQDGTIAAAGLEAL